MKTLLETEKYKNSNVKKVVKNINKRFKNKSAIEEENQNVLKQSIDDLYSNDDDYNSRLYGNVNLYR